MPYQFVHMEGYARKADKGGRSVSWVLDEVERKPGACVHVEDPQPPSVVYGATPAEVRAMHDQACEGAKVTLSNGKQRAVRSDQKTLLTVVASHPATMDEMRSDPKVAADVAAWERLTIDWLKGQYGDELVSVVRHEDESHPHLHAYILPGHLRAMSLHPGAEAKRQVKAAGAQDGEDAKALNKRGDAAYKGAMREWQDSYHEKVGIPCGFTRLGPKNRRMSRAEWMAEQAQATALKKAMARADRLTEQGKQAVERTKSRIESELGKAELQAEEIRAAAQREVEALKAEALRVADAAKAEADRQAQEAEAKRLEAEREAAAATRLKDAAAKEHRNARTIRQRAEAEAGRIIADAKEMAARVSSIGTRIRTFFDGFRESSIRKEVEADAAKVIEAEREKAQEGWRRAAEEHDRRRSAEQRATNATSSARALGSDLQQTREQLQKLGPKAKAKATSTYGV